MQAKLDGSRVVLDEKPTGGEGHIHVFFEGENTGGMKRLEIREGMQSYDLPEGVTPESVTKLEVGKMEEEDAEDDTDDTDDDSTEESTDAEKVNE